MRIENTGIGFSFLLCYTWNKKKETEHRNEKITRSRTGIDDDYLGI